MNRSLFGGLFFILTSVFLASCEKPEGMVVARVGKAVITTKELQSRLEETPSAYQQYAASAEGRLQFLKLLVREKVLWLEGKKAGMASEPTYKESVKRFHENLERRTKQYEETLLVQSYMRKLRSKDLAVTDADLRKYYDEHIDEYQKPIEVQASHILLSTEAEANTALDRLAKGESFEKVAASMSKDPGSAARGGKLGAFRKGTLVPDFEKAAFALKTGETSGLVKTQFGFHIIRKTGQTQMPARPFESSRDDIRIRLERDRFDQWVTQKEKEVGVQIDESAMATFNPAPPQEPSPQ